MKKKDIIDLITAHYEDDPRLFFHRTIEILKEFQKDGDKELVEYVSNILKGKVKIAPKREVTKLKDLHEEISFDDAIYLDWIPMSEPQNLETNKEDIEFQRKQEDIKSKLGFSLNDMLKCPKCGSHNIESNKDISNPFIRCKNCGYYLRDGKKSIFEEPAYALDESKPKNSNYVAVDYTRDGTIICRSTDNPKEAVTAKELKKLFN